MRQIAELKRVTVFLGLVIDLAMNESQESGIRSQEWPSLNYKNVLYKLLQEVFIKDNLGNG